MPEYESTRKLTVGISSLEGFPREKERINIGPMAREIAKTGTVPSGRLPSTKGIKEDSDEAYGAYSRIKKELYAISAVVADHANKTACATFDSDLCVKHIGTYLPFIELEDYTQSHIKSVFSGQHRRILANPKDPMYPIYRRLAQLIMLEHQLIPNARPEYDIDGYFQQGIKTASLVMANTLDVISKLVGRSNPDQAAQVAANSFPFICQLSCSHVDAFMTVAKRLNDREKEDYVFDPKFFTIKSETVAHSRLFGNLEVLEPERLVFSDKGNMVIEDALNGSNMRDYRAESSPTVGCIAMANIEGGSGVKLLWNEHVKIAQKLYPILAAKRQTGTSRWIA